MSARSPSTPAWIAAARGFCRRQYHGIPSPWRPVSGPTRSPNSTGNRKRRWRACGRCLRRAAPGLIRRGHGDLHLGNIAVLDGEPVAFDALEFDPVIAAGDVLYDLAFLLMDLVERGLERAANTVLNGYFAASRRREDCDGIAALPFFMSLRAAIRAKVTAARLDLGAADDRQEAAQSARRYFDLALELLAPAKPVVVCIGGLSGTGKSFLARRSRRTAADAGRAGVSLRCRAQGPVRCRRARSVAGRAYRAEVSEEIYRVLTDKAARVARAGHSVILDAVFAKAARARGNRDGGRRGRRRFSRPVPDADLPTRLQRVGGRGPDASDADAEVARKQEDFDIGAVTWAVIDASGSPEADACQSARRRA